MTFDDYKIVTLRKKELERLVIRHQNLKQKLRRIDPKNKAEYLDVLDKIRKNDNRLFANKVYTEKDIYFTLLEEFPIFPPYGMYSGENVLYRVGFMKIDPDEDPANYWPQFEAYPRYASNSRKKKDSDNYSQESESYLKYVPSSCKDADFALYRNINNSKRYHFVRMDKIDDFEAANRIIIGEDIQEECDSLEEYHKLKTQYEDGLYTEYNCIRARMFKIITNGYPLEMALEEIFKLYNSTPAHKKRGRNARKYPQ